MADAFADVDPKRRLKWVGPDMSARSSVTARFMETWSHAQALYDALGVERLNTDRIRNVVVLGVNTFGWTFANRKEEVPSAMPELRLTAPSATSGSGVRRAMTNTFRERRSVLPGHPGS